MTAVMAARSVPESAVVKLVAVGTTVSWLLTASRKRLFILSLYACKQCLEVMTLWIECPTQIYNKSALQPWETISPSCFVIHVNTSLTIEMNSKFCTDLCTGLECRTTCNGKQLHLACVELHVDCIQACHVL